MDKSLFRQNIVLALLTGGFMSLYPLTVEDSAKILDEEVPKKESDRTSLIQAAYAVLLDQQSQVIADQLF